MKRIIFIKLGNEAIAYFQHALLFALKSFALFASEKHWELVSERIAFKKHINVNLEKFRKTKEND